MQLLLKTLLEIEGFSVFIPNFFNVETIIEQITSINPNYIYMDVNLRQMSGLDLLKYLRSNDLYHFIKIIMSSGLPLQEDCLKLGADIFFQKPYSPDILVNWLRMH